MNPTQPDQGENECTPDSSAIVLIEADGPEDRTIRPLPPHYLRRPQIPPVQQPPPVNGAPPERGPETK